MATTNVGRTPPVAASVNLTPAISGQAAGTVKQSSFGQDQFQQHVPTGSGDSTDWIGKYENWMHSRQGAQVTALGTGLASLGLLVQAFRWQSPVLATVSLITGISALLHGKRSEHLPS